MDPADLQSFVDKFVAAMDEDINAANGITVVFELAKWINSGHYNQDVKEALAKMLEVFGVVFVEEVLDADIEALIAERQEARAKKDFARADEIRDELMPINKVHPMDDLREAISEYIDKTNRRVTFEYIMLKGVNDDIVYARQLAHYLRGLNAYVNLIPYNSVDEHGYQPSDKETVEIFKNELLRLHINVTLRKEHGRDIDGACGQLRAKRSGVK